MRTMLFGFRGRLGRRSYLHQAMLVSILSTVWILAVYAGAVAVATKGGLAGSALFAAAGAVPVLWMSLALATKRLRDAGFPPLLVLPPMVVYALVDTFLLSQQTGGTALVSIPHSTPYGLVVNLAFCLLLLVWPSAEAGDDAGRADGTPRSGDVPWHARVLAAESAAAPQALTPYPPRVPSVGRFRTFGRRVA